MEFLVPGGFISLSSPITLQTLSILHSPLLLLVANVAWALLTLIHTGNFLGYPHLDR